MYNCLVQKFKSKGNIRKKSPYLCNKEDPVRVPGTQERLHKCEAIYKDSVPQKKKKGLNEDLLLRLKLFPLKTSNFTKMFWIP